MLAAGLESESFVTLTLLHCFGSYCRREGFAMVLDDGIQSHFLTCAGKYFENIMLLLEPNFAAIIFNIFMALPS